MVPVQGLKMHLQNIQAYLSKLWRIRRKGRFTVIENMGRKHGMLRNILLQRIGGRGLSLSKAYCTPVPPAMAITQLNPLYILH